CNDGNYRTLAADMRPRPPTARQFHLAVTFGITGPVGFAAAIVAMMARHAFDKEGRLLIRCRQRMPACPAQFRLAFAQSVGDGHALVEDEALAVPQALLLRYVLEVFQDATLELVDLLDADRPH